MAENNLFDPEATFEDNIISLAQGNPGAAKVLTRIVKNDKAKAAMVFEDLSKMNMYGPRIWIGFKDYCDEDLEDFIECVLSQDEELVTVVNENKGSGGERVTTVR